MMEKEFMIKTMPNNLVTGINNGSLKKLLIAGEHRKSIKYKEIPKRKFIMKTVL